ncbi:GOLPH3/VPS74 family protein [Geodermatophilus sp. URMC 62]|uniref:GOLPH3/VPS74 family protein n=1 Tax=Geodermatophilus sp. URMC 62 TaxID=3423414 RepID=UPI00406D149C
MPEDHERPDPTRGGPGAGGVPGVPALSLPEQLVLLAVDPDRGRLRGAPVVHVAVAGGVVLDLLDGGVAVVQDGAVRVRHPAAATPLPGPLQEAAVAAVPAGGSSDVRRWVRDLAAPRFRLGQHVKAGLTQRGVLRTGWGLRFGLVPARRHHVLDSAAREELLAGCREALTGTAPPPPRVRELLVLTGAAGLLHLLVDRSQRAAARQRVDRLTLEVPGAAAVARAVADVGAEVRAAARRRARAAAIAASTGGTHGS